MIINMIIDKSSLFKTLGSQARLRILACLYETQAELTLRQIADYTHMHFASVQGGIGLLETQRLVYKRSVGRAHLYTLYHDHYVSTDILPGLLTDRLAECVQALSKLLQKHCSTLCLFGSYARRTTNASSDLDVLILTQHKAAIEKLLQRHSPVLEKRYGLLLSPYIQTPAAFVLALKQKKQTEISILKTHQLISGTPLRALSA